MYPAWISKVHFRFTDWTRVPYPQQDGETRTQAGRAGDGGRKRKWIEEEKKRDGVKRRSENKRLSIRLTDTETVAVAGTGQGTHLERQSHHCTATRFREQDGHVKHRQERENEDTARRNRGETVSPVWERRQSDIQPLMAVSTSSYMSTVVGDTRGHHCRRERETVTWMKWLKR